MQFSFPKAGQPEPPKTSSANKHTVDRLLDDLCVPGILERRARDGPDKPLVEYIDAECRTIPPEQQSKFAKELYARLERRAADK